jgi:hypothetical protein
LGGAIADDGTFGLFVAEMRERGPRYLSHAEPVATWLARIDPVTLALISFEPARDASAALYGWSVASDDRHTYLYGHCYRQFGFSPIGHDACAADVTVARTALGALDAPLQYWNGTNWVDDPAAAVNIAPAAAPSGQPRSINPMQIAHVDGVWLAVTKDGDWWGTTIYVDEASEPTGPWTTTAVVDAIPLGRQDRYDTYFASLIPTTDGKLVIGLSNNRWDGRTSGAYRPTFTALPDVGWALQRACQTRLVTPGAFSGQPSPRTRRAVRGTRGG